MLRKINIVPDEVLPADIDEDPLENEKPENLVKRLSQRKAEVISEKKPDFFVLGADTVVACGKNILEKAKNAEEAGEFLLKLSGRRHYVYGGITLITPQKKLITRTSKTMVQFKKLSDQEIEHYVASKEWEGKAGAYAIQGFAGCFVKRIDGSYSNVVGLSLYDTIKILESGGLKPTDFKQG